MGKLVQLILNHPGGRYTILLLLGLLTGTLIYSNLAERPLWAYFTLAVIGLVPLALFVTNRRVVHLYGIAVIAVLMGCVYFADTAQESEHEKVLRITQELLRAVERADYTVFDRHLAPDFRWQSMNRAAMMNRVRTALLPNESRSCSISSAKVREPLGSSNYTVEGNLSASGRFGREDGFFSGTIELRYAKQSDGSFKVTGSKVAWINGGEVTIPPGR